MRVLNESVIPSELLIPILRRMAQLAGPDVRNCMFHFVSEGEEFSRTNCVVVGDAYPKGGWRGGLNEKHLVRVCIPRTLFDTCRYPRSQQYTENCHEGPCHRFETWHEEVGETIAHELRHVKQFEDGWLPFHNKGDDVRAELDAEQFGAEALAKYRTWQPRYMPQVSKFQLGMKRVSA